MNTSNLVITALTQSSIDAPSKIATLITESGCNIITNRMVVMGQECMISMQVVGNWSSIAKLEHSLPNLEKKHGFALISRRRKPWPKRSPL